MNTELIKTPLLKTLTKLSEHYLEEVEILKRAAVESNNDGNDLVVSNPQNAEVQTLIKKYKSNAVLLNEIRLQVEMAFEDVHKSNLCGRELRMLHKLELIDDREYAFLAAEAVIS